MTDAAPATPTATGGVAVALHAGQLLQPVPGGIGRYVEALATGLDAFGVTVEAFAAGPCPDGLAAAVAQRRARWHDLGWPGGGVRYELWHRLRRPRVAVPGSIVHAPSLAVPPRDDRPLIVTVHGLEFMRHPDATTRRGHSFHRRGLALAARDAELIIAPSEFTRRDLLREGFDPARVRTIHEGCDPVAPVADEIVNARVNSLGISGRYVLTVGTVEPRKQLDVLVDAFRQVRVAHPDVALIIAGPDGWGDVGDLDAPGVRRVGRLPWNQLDALYRRAQLCCFTSVYEGFGLPVAEALARGCPVVATRGTAYEEVMGDAGVVVPTGDADATATAMLTLLDDDNERAQLAAQGRDRVAHMSWTRAVEQHATVYRELASR